MPSMKIGALASTTGCQVQTIRYYEQQGLLAEPARTGANYRLYDDAHVERLRFIRHCRSLDMSLDEIRVLLRFRDAPAENCARVNELLDEHVGHVARRIAELQALERQLKELRGLCSIARPVTDCGIMRGLTAKARRGATNLGTHGRSRH